MITGAHVASVEAGNLYRFTTQVQLYMKVEILCYFPSYKSLSTYGVSLVFMRCVVLKT